MTEAVDLVRVEFRPGDLAFLNGVLALLMFGVALDLRLEDFRALLRTPRSALVGVAAQLLLLPAVTFVLVQLLRPPPSVALGMMLVAACPGGNVSNFLVYLARGNVALSVGMTSVTSLASVVMLPLNLAFWASLDPHTAALMKSVAVDGPSMLSSVALMVGMPLGLGMAVGFAFPAWAARVRRPLRVGGGFVFLGFIAMAFVKNRGVLGPEVFPVLGVALLHNLTALATGWLAGVVARMPRADVHAVAIEVGIQNSGLGLALVFNFFGGLGGMAVLAAWWGVAHLLTGLTLASLWGRRRRESTGPEPILEGAT